VEKDYFHDRSFQAKYFDLIEEGDMVYICEKHMQRVATSIEHLTYGKVLKVLTRKDHTRGIKVEISIYRSKYSNLQVKPGSKAIGRVTYLEVDGQIHRS